MTLRKTLTSACFLANSDPSAFRFFMMSSMLPALNSLKEEDQSEVQHATSLRVSKRFTLHQLDGRTRLVPVQLI